MFGKRWKGPHKSFGPAIRQSPHKASLAVAVVGLSISLLAFAVSYDRELRLARESANTEFFREATERYTAIQNQLAHSAEAVFALGRLFVASEVIYPREFFAFTDPWLRRHPSLVSLEWIPEVPSERRTHFEKSVRSYYPEYSIRAFPGSVVDSVSMHKKGDLHYPVQYLNPPAANEGLLGLDFATDPRRLETLQRARRTGEIAVSQRLPLAERGEGRYGTFIICPVDNLQRPEWQDGGGPYRGFAVLTLRIGEVVEETMRTQPPVGFDLWIIDRSAPAGEQFLYHYREDRTGTDDAEQPPRLDGNYLEQKLTVGDRVWAFVAVPREGGHPAEPSLWPWLILLAGLAGTGGLVAYVVTQNRTAARIAESEERFRLIAENTRDLIATTDERGRLEYTSPAVTATLGDPAEKLSGQKAWRWIHREDIPQLRRANGKFVKFRVQTQRGWRWLEGAAFPVLMSNRRYFVMTARDITQRVRREKKLKVLNRTLSLLSRGNEALIAADDEEDLYRRICKEVVKTGGYRAAWIAFFDAGDKLRLRAHDGKLGQWLMPCLSQVEGGWPGRVSQMPSCTVISDLDTLPCAKRLRENGARAMLLLPLRDSKGAVGILGMASNDPELLDDGESNLLQRLAANLVFGIRTARDREALRLRQRVVEVSQSGVVIIDISGSEHRIEYVNPAFSRITGLEYKEAVGRPSEILFENVEENLFSLRRIYRAIRRRGAESVELKARRPDGEYYWIEIQLAPVPGRRGAVTHYAAVFNDITERRRYRAELEHQANHDELTGLPNRNLLRDRLERALARARRHSNMVAVLFLDIDQFKVVNDSLGHPQGDALLQQLAPRLHPFCRGTDTIARYGGDEFVMVADEVPGRQAVARLAERLRSAVSQPVKIGDHQLMVTCSVGAALYPQHGATPDILLSNADAAMYRAKERGRNRFEFFAPALARRAKSRLTQETSLRRALANNEFEVFYQPQVRLSDGRFSGLEALVRWRQGPDQYVRPMSFMDLAEETGLVIPLGEFVLRTACRQAAEWRKAGYGDLVMAVNLSARQVEQGALVGVVHRVLEQTGLPAHLLELELTESSIMREPERMAIVLGHLKQLGVELAIDDFGTGYSSLAKLQRFPFDKLKIDKSFITSLDENIADASLSEAIIAMARALDMKVIAEGVESARQMDFLRRRGCDQVQGYFISKPLERRAAQRLLASSAGRLGP